MLPSNDFDPVEMTERFFTIIKSLNQFDKAHLRGVVNTLLGEKTDREICYLGGYYRAIANIETLLLLKSSKEFQIIAMIVRSLFEIAVDSRLLSKVTDGEKKMIAYSGAEKLRSANKIIAFKNANPDAALDVSIYQEFIDKESARIDAQCATLWPGVKSSDIQHWSRMKLPKRVAELKTPFEQIYAVNYPQLSWYVHSGLTGVINVKKETFGIFAGVAFTLAAECYSLIMTDVIDVLKLAKATEKIKEMMTLAKMLPFTNGAAQARALEAELLR